MRLLTASLLVIGCVSSIAGASQARGGATAPGNACALLTRELAMKVSTAGGRKVLERAKPDDGTEDMAVATGASACKYGRVFLVLDPFGRPDQVRKEMRARGGPRDRSGATIYKNHEPVSGVGDEAFFNSNSAFANLDVWTGSRHFSIQMGAGFDDDASALKPNVIALAKAIVPLLR